MTSALIGPPKNVSTAQRNAFAAGSRPPGMIIFNTDNSRLEYNSGSDATPNWLTYEPSQYGVAFPTTGLFTGFRFTLFLADPVAGQLSVPCIYRNDLDATYPWHSETTNMVISGNNGVHTTSPQSTIAAVITFTAPRNGVYGYSYTSYGSSNGSSPQHRTNIAGSASAWFPASQPFGGKVTLNAAQTIIIQHTNDFSNINLSDSAEAGVGLFYPHKLI